MEVFALAGVQAKTASFIQTFIKEVVGDETCTIHELTNGSLATLGIKEESLPSSSAKEGVAPSHGFKQTLNSIAQASRLRSFLLGEGKVHGAVNSWLTWLDGNRGNLAAADLDHLNKELSSKTFLAANNLTLADLALFCPVRQWISKATVAEQASLVHIVRWFNHIQSINGVTDSFKHPIDIEAISAALSQPAKPADAKAAKAEAKAAKAEAKAEKAPKVEKKDVPVERGLDDFSRLNVVVGKIVKVWPHPEAERLWCEEIDCGEGKTRQIASGLREHYSAEDMLNRMVVVLANLKPRALRGFESHGMVLCASSDAKVELLEPAVGSKPGDRVMVEGYAGEADSVLNPKKNPFEVIAPELKTDASAKPVAMYKGVALTTSAGPVTCPTAANTEIH